MIRDGLLELMRPFGMEADDCKSTPMGSSGVDVQLSPAFRKLLNLSIEAKNVEKLNIPTTFFEHYEKYKGDTSLKLLIHSRNRSEPLVTLRWADMLPLLGFIVRANEKQITQ